MMNAAAKINREDAGYAGFRKDAKNRQQDLGYATIP